VTIAAQIGRVNAGLESKRRASEFHSYAHTLMAAHSLGMSPLDLVEVVRAPQSVVDYFKAQVGSLTSESELAQLRQLSGGFLASLVTASAFDGILPDMQPGQLHSIFACVTGNATAYVHLQGAAKKLSQLTLAQNVLRERKVAALVVTSDEVLRFNTGAADLIGRSLRQSVGSASDELFIDELVAGVTPLSGSGTDAEGVYADLRALIDAIELGDGSRPHFIVSSQIAKFLSFLATSAGAGAFPSMSPTGGTIGNVPTHISSHADSNVVLVDASAIVAVSESIQLRTASAGSVEMRDDPTSATASGSPLTSTESSQVSLFQTNGVALLAERTLAFELVRASGVAVLDASTWPASGSPLV